MSEKIIKIKIDKTAQRAELEIGEEAVAFSFQFLQSLVMDFMSNKEQIYVKEIPLK